MPLGTEVGLGPNDIVLDGESDLPVPKKAQPRPEFTADVHCGQTAGWTKMPRRPHCARWEFSSPEKGHSPQFLAHVYCGQTVAHLCCC